MNDLPPTSKRPLLRLWLLFVFCFLVTLVLAFAPWMINSPMKMSSPGTQVLFFNLRNWGPPLTILLTLIGLVCCGLLWMRGRHWFHRTALVVLLLPVLGATWFSWQNPLEWMFNPLEEPAYSSIEETDFLEDKDMVLAVSIGDESVAYPVRQVAYHHIVQDVVGGTPITVTY